MVITHKLRPMDLTCKNVAQRVDVMQDDKFSRCLALPIRANGADVELPEDVRAVIRFRKPDGTGGNYDTLPDGTSAYTISGSVITVALAPQVCTVPSMVQMAVCLMRGNAEINTFVILVNVHANPGIDAESQDYTNMRAYVKSYGWPPDKTLRTDADGNVIAAEITAVDTTLTQSGKAADAAAVGDRLSALSEEIADGVSWNELKDKPFYMNKTLFVELTKDDFTVNDQDGYIKYMYRSTPKLDWFTSAESIAFEIEIVDTNGRRYTATQDSIDVYFENDNTDDGYEYWCCYSNLFEMVSGVDLDFYDDEYYYKDEWGVLVSYAGIEFSEINIKIYRVDVKKIPKICLDAAIGKTAITVGGVLEDSEAEMSPSVIVPDLCIPISPPESDEEIYYDRISKRLRISGYLFPYNGKIINYTFRQVMPTTAGSSISFDISSEGDTLWDAIGWNSHWASGRYLTFRLSSSYSGGGIIEFLSCGPSISDRSGVVASSNFGRLYTVVFKYTNSYKALNVTLKCVAE